MKIGYARVSTQDQTAALQLDALRAAGCERIFEETASGANADRPGLADALAFARPGDVLVIWRLDRLGRSLRDLIDLAADLREREVGLSSLQEAIDTTTAGGKMLFHIMAALAEFERNLIQERTTAGLAAARARGRKGGRPGISPAVKEAIKSAAADPTANITAVCEALGINRATFYRHAPKVAEVKADAPAPSPVVNKSRKRAA
ncbi:recombinase family protein [Azospira oryzae]|uniref:recombinase family protein n=1 Tax=Azospira oryzae TaxID=146939 RepID=UPI0019659F24|nr:recombinase family protein [Azospira oryzae]